MPERTAEVLKAAQDLAQRAPNWVEFFREILGVGGLVRQTYRGEDLLSFQRSAEYREILTLLTALRAKKSTTTPKDDEGERLLTIRVPKSLYDALSAEAEERHTTLAKLGVSKLLQTVDAGLVPSSAEGIASEAMPTPLALYFDASEFKPEMAAEVISALSDLYREIGGDGLVIEGMSFLEPAPVPEPVGG